MLIIGELRDLRNNRESYSTVQAQGIGTAFREHPADTYLLTAWCRVLLEKLTGLQIAKKFLEFHGARRFITALRYVRHLSLSWASPVQTI
jgi:hypothetical protein